MTDEQNTPSDDTYFLEKFEDEEENKKGFTINGVCPTCKSGRNSLVILKTKALNQTKMKLGVKCINCLTVFDIHY